MVTRKSTSRGVKLGVICIALIALNLATFFFFLLRSDDDDVQILHQDTILNRFSSYGVVESVMEPVFRWNGSRIRTYENVIPPPIDVVYTWVNGSDPVWFSKYILFKSIRKRKTLSEKLARKVVALDSDLLKPITGLIKQAEVLDRTIDAMRMYQKRISAGNVISKLEIPIEDTDGSTSFNRFRENDQLRYSLRSIEKYASWVRNIIIVTDNQIPNWLNLRNPRVRIVPHTDIFRNLFNLPTFNSNSIDANLLNIQNISSSFLYINDDMVLGQPTSLDDFRTKSEGQLIYSDFQLDTCSRRCYLEMLDNGICNPECYNEGCNFDYGDCLDEKNNYAMILQKGWCDEFCPTVLLTSGTCISGCNKPECGYNLGACSQSADLKSSFPYVWVNETNFMELVTIPILRPESAGEKKFMPLDYGTQAIGIDLSSFLLEHNTSAVNFDIENSDFALAFYFDNNASVLHIVLKKNAVEELGGIDMNDVEKKTAGASNWQCSSNSQLEGCSLPASHNGACVAFDDFDAAKRMCIIRGSSCSGVTSSTFYDGIVPMMHELRAASVMTPSRSSEISCLKKSQPVLRSANTRTRPLSVAVVSVKFKLENGTLAQFYFGAHSDNSADNPTISSSMGHPRVLKYYPHRRIRHEDDDSSDTESASQFNNSLRRNLFDLFWSSMYHTDVMFKKYLGVKNEGKVTAHIPYFMNKNKLRHLFDVIRSSVDAANKNRFRSTMDLALPYGYNSWIMQERSWLATMKNREYFDRFLDKDGNGLLDMNELKDFVDMVLDCEIILWDTKYLQRNRNVSETEAIFAQCMDHSVEWHPNYKRNVSRLIGFSYDQMMNCKITRAGFVAIRSETTNYRKIFPSSKTYSFLMISDNYRGAMKSLSRLRNVRSKFICINDDMKYSNPKIMRAVIDALDSFLQNPSQFELPENQLNQVLYYNKYLQSKK